MKDHSLANYAGLARPPDRLKLLHVKSAVTNAHLASNLVLMVVANHVHVVPTEPKVYNLPVLPAPSAEPHPRSAHHLSKNAHCPYVLQEPTSTER